ncbi:MAG: Glycosyltransferase [Parcubacteria group bacterium GW2011_GWE2_39_37]|uniref:Glycosyltransferase n=1 Tax=Candidatus Falkowbacteria bacterium GW2011_GWF2_39_8 TaxID=1618642 RepID=A0A0G0T0D4_9BACT|nr:MAG: Glycosyltransferase [Parcubacteria group bacterium GW2011_GWE2_39_37]KKR31292.1 MAG: Glycosyltransferase [Candidatus Falkowbacteria bacterium GW2011_GWF2_39_8]
MKIAHIICTFPPYKGGMGNSAFHFARITSELGHDVTVFSPDYLNLEYSDSEKFKIVRLKPFFKYGNAAVLPQLTWKLSAFDIVHFHYPFYGADLFVLLAKIFNRKIKLITHYHMDNVAPGIKGLIFHIGRNILFPLIAKNSVFLTCASVDYVEHSKIAMIYQRDKTKWRTVPFGVDIDKFNGDKDTEKDQLSKTILFVAALDKAHYFKGLENLINATKNLIEDAQIINSNITVKLDIVGGGNMLEYYKDIAQQLGISANINFAGRVEDEQLVEHYKDCDVFTLPSINQGEAFGMVLLEAMASGKPVIASNLPGVRSVFTDKAEGLLVEPDDISDLTEKLKRILLDDGLANKMGEAGRNLAKKEYAWSVISKKLDNVYQEVSN